jgi:hypothetical protein
MLIVGWASGFNFFQKKGWFSPLFTFTLWCAAPDVFISPFHGVQCTIYKPFPGGSQDGPLLVMLITRVYRHDFCILFSFS